MIYMAVKKSPYFYKIIQLRPNIAYLIRQISFTRILIFHGVLTLTKTNKQTGSNQ